jgi:glycosyltransferase involved in cell wall biosynthesis
LASKAKILCVTLEPISVQMAGPAIRCVELAKELAKRFQVTVYSPRPTNIDVQIYSQQNVQLVTGTSKADLYALAREHDVLFLQANVLKPYPLLARLDKRIVVDLYDPYLLAVLAQFDPDDISAHASYNLMHQVLERHMEIADFTVCASERQRDYWLGRFCALGRLTPEMYKFDRSFRKLIDVVPFGMPNEKPQRTGAGMKGTVPGITEKDFVLLWGGGIWEWFDPLTVIKAVAESSKRHPNLKLYFMGFKSPNPQVPLMEMAVRAKALAEQLGVKDKHVFFNESWTSYEDRVNYLLDADVAVSAHFDLPETRFSFRTRILDYLWAGLPVLTTCGDQLADMIQAGQAGQALNYEDTQAWVNAIDSLIADKSLQEKNRAGATAVGAQFSWNKVAQPLINFCEHPHKLPKFHEVRMPSIVDRARAVYSRGGKDLVLQRSRELLGDILRR